VPHGHHIKPSNKWIQTRKEEEKGKGKEAPRYNIRHDTEYKQFYVCVLQRPSAPDLWLCAISLGVFQKADDGAGIGLLCRVRERTFCGEEVLPTCPIKAS